MMRRLCITVSLCVLLLPRPSQGQMFEIATKVLGHEKLLGGLFGEAFGDITDGGKLIQILHLLQESTGYARDTAAFARESVQVGKNVKALVDNPAAFTAYAMRTWLDSYPELYSILANVESARESLYEATHPEMLADYDPMAYVNVFDRMVNATNSRFHVMMDVADIFGPDSAHDEMLKQANFEHEKALEQLERVAELLNSGGLSPVQASVETARSVAISAAATTRAAATMQDLKRVASIQLGNAFYGSVADNARRNEEARAISEMDPWDWSLDPLSISHQRKFREQQASP